MRLLLVAASAVLVVASACGEQGTAPPVKRGGTMADSADQVMLKIRMLLTNHGVQRGEMFADTAYVFDDNTRIELRKVTATFNTTVGAKNGVLSADRGRYNMREAKLEGFGNVVIVTNEGKRLTSPHIRYLQGINEVSSDSSFTMVEPGRNLSGVGFKADPQLTRFQVLSSGTGRGSIDLPVQ